MNEEEPLLDNINALIDAMVVGYPNAKAGLTVLSNAFGGLTSKLDANSRAEYFEEFEKYVVQARKVLTDCLDDRNVT